MSRRKHLTFKKLDPKKVKLLAIIYVVLFLVFPNVRYNTGEIFHFVGNTIQSTSN